MGEQIVERTRSPLAYVGPTPAGTGELYENSPEDGARRTMVVLDPDTWVEMGTPLVITVTIEPGDLLNDGLPSGYVARAMADADWTDAEVGAAMDAAAAARTAG